MAKKQRYGKTSEGSAFLKPLTTMNDAQSYYMDMIREMTITFCTGPAGTSKTYLATYLALEALLVDRTVKKIVLTRPIVAVEDIGYLPGDMQEKIHPYILPLFDAVEDHVGPTKTKELIENGFIDIIPLAYMRGRSLNECVTGDSMVLLASGEEIRIDELLKRYNDGEEIIVKSYNLETKEIEDSPISFAFKKPSKKKLIKITLEDGTVLKVTKNHELYVDGRGYVEASQIQENDELLKIKSSFDNLKNIKLTKIEEIDEEDVYDITVPGNHNFFLNKTLSSNCFLVLDEAQNTTKEQMKMFLTRLGFDSKMVITGDLSQVDLPKHIDPGLDWAVNRLRGANPLIGVNEFTVHAQVRNPLITEMLAHLEGPGKVDQTSRRENTFSAMARKSILLGS